MVTKKHGMFRGLFIGINRYASDAISWLSCDVSAYLRREADKATLAALIAEVDAAA